jgi:hypothetical protein
MSSAEFGPSDGFRYTVALLAQQIASEEDLEDLLDEIRLAGSDARRPVEERAAELASRFLGSEPPDVEGWPGQVPQEVQDEAFALLGAIDSWIWLASAPVVAFYASVEAPEVGAKLLKRLPGPWAIGMKDKVAKRLREFSADWAPALRNLSRIVGATSFGVDVAPFRTAFRSGSRGWDGM